jgi:hypothetical protein
LLLSAIDSDPAADTVRFHFSQERNLRYRKRKILPLPEAQNRRNMAYP